MLKISDLGVVLLEACHVDALQLYAADPRITATTRVPHPYPPDGARTYVAAMTAARQAGTDFVFAIERRRQFAGVIGLHGVTPTAARELGFWVAVPFQRQGLATFAARNVLEFAFHNRGLERVGAQALADNLASRRVLERSGFVATGEILNTDPALHAPGARIAQYQLTAGRWRAGRDGPVLAVLHPALRAILQAELAAGNEVRETGQGWPDADSVHVRLRHPFRTHPVLPAGLVHNVPNDPHWWLADYTTVEPPRHMLSY